MRLRELRRISPFAFLALTAGLAGSLVLLAVLEAAVLRPIPGVAQPQQLLSLQRPDRLSYPAFHDLASAVARDPSLLGAAAFAERSFAVASGSGPERRATGAVIAGDYFRLLGARAERGRLLGAGDDHADAPPIVVISYGFWRNELGGGDAAIGSTLRLNGTPFQIVGVAAPAFRGLVRESRPDFWVTAPAWFANAPTSFADLSLDRRGWSWLRVVVRRAPATSVERAGAAISAELRRQLEADPRQTDEDFAQPRLVASTLVAAGLPSQRVARGVSGAIATAVALLLLLAVVSATQVFLAQADRRTIELATRLALGADRWRLVRMLLAAPLWTAICSIAAALGLARLILSRLAGQALPGGLRLGELGLAIDARVAFAGTALALACGFAAGWQPASRASRRDPARTLAAGRSILAGRAGLRRALAGVQVAISLLLVTATALCARSLGRATGIETGYRGEHLGFVRMDAGLARLGPHEARSRYDAALQAARQTPGVERVALLSAAPLDPAADTESFSVPGYVPAERERLEAEVSVVGAGALQTLGIGLVAGRDFESADAAGDRVCVVSAAFARRYLAGRDPVGATVIVGVPLRVIGVARDVRAHGPAALQPPTIYGLWDQMPDDFATRPQLLAFRSAGNPGAMLGTVAQAASQAAAGVPVEPLGTYDEMLDRALAAQRFGAALFGLFSIIALVLAAAGLFGLTSQAAAARRRELGLRSALGARPAGLVALLVRGSLTPVLAGGALGALASVALAGAARGLFVGLERFDLGALLSAVSILAFTALAATLGPALVALRGEPAAALRGE